MSISAFAGRMMIADLVEQPRVWRDILARRRCTASLGRVIADRAPDFVLLAARDTSDHAALYVKYVIEILQSCLASPPSSCRPPS